MSSMFPSKSSSSKIYLYHEKEIINSGTPWTSHTLFFPQLLRKCNGWACKLSHMPRGGLEGLYFWGLYFFVKNTKKKFRNSFIQYWSFPNASSVDYRYRNVSFLWIYLCSTFLPEEKILLEEKDIRWHAWNTRTAIEQTRGQDLFSIILECRTHNKEFKLHEIRFRLNIRGGNPSVKAVQQWNQLPQEWWMLQHCMDSRERWTIICQISFDLDTYIEQGVGLL